MGGTDFSRNLLLLCSYHRSISEVCRRLGINRQQFNKYLSGRTMPSRNNLRRICDFFGVEEAEILLPHRRLSEIVQLRPHARDRGGQAPHYRHHLDVLLQKGGKGLDAYLGYYFRYFYSYGFPGFIVKSLLGLFAKDDTFYTKNVGVLSAAQEGRTYTVRFKYLGLPLLINDRIFLIEYESVLRDMVSETILYPAYRNRVDLLSGMQCTLAGRRGREPAAGRVVLEHLGRDIDVRQAMRSCGLFRHDSPAIDRSIEHRIRNTIDPGQHVLGLWEP